RARGVARAGEGGGGVGDRGGVHRLAEGRRPRGAGADAGGTARGREARQGGRRGVPRRGEGPGHVGPERIPGDVRDAAGSTDDGGGVGGAQGEGAGRREGGGAGGRIGGDGGHARGRDRPRRGRGPCAER